MEKYFLEEELSELEKAEIRGGFNSESENAQRSCTNNEALCGGGSQPNCTNNTAGCGATTDQEECTNEAGGCGSSHLNC